MNKCTRFEDEGLLKLERGEELDEHYHNCKDCLEAKAKYARLKVLLSESSENVKPKKGWDNAVLDKIENDAPSPLKYSKKLLLPLSIAAALALVFINLNELTPSKVTLTSEISKSNKVYRGTTAQPGDTIILTATVNQNYAYLRTYLNDTTLIHECGYSNPCSIVGDNINVSFSLEGVGDYQTLLIYSSEPINVPVAVNLDQDIINARKLGIEFIMNPIVEVR